MANNPILQNAALAGITGGTQERWIDGAIPIETQTIINTLVAAIDTAIDPAEYDQRHADLMQSICQGVFADRFPFNANDTSIAIAIANLFAQQSEELVANSDPGTQTAWFISANGNDANSGSSASQALKTGAEWGRRLSNQRISVNVVTTILGSLAADDIPIIENSTLQAGNTFYVDGTATTIASDTVSGVVADASSGGSPWTLTISDSSLMSKGDRVRFTSGAITDYVCWIYEVVDGTHIRVTSLMGDLAGVNATPTNQTFVVESLSTVTQIHCGITPDVQLPDIFSFDLTQNAVRFRHLDINGSQTDLTSFIQNAAFFGCALRNSGLKGDIGTLRSCLRDLSNVSSVFDIEDVFSSVEIIEGGMGCDISGLLGGTGYWYINSVLANLNARPCVIDGGVSMFGCVYVFLGNNTGLHIEDWGDTAGVFVAGNSRLQANGKITGSSAVGAGIRVAAACVMTYISGRKPTIAGTSDVSVGGVALAYAAIPNFNTSNGAGMVVYAL